MEYVLDFAWSKDCYKVMVLTGLQNTGAACFYNAVGFTSSKQGFVASPDVKGEPS